MKCPLTKIVNSSEMNKMGIPSSLILIFCTDEKIPFQFLERGFNHFKNYY